MELSNTATTHDHAPRAASSDATPGRSQNIPYLVGIDHLRCAAALLIFYFHGLPACWAVLGAPTWRMVSNPFLALLVEGHTAVALFMVLSGFSFAFGTFGKRISYRQFLANRFFRTYPLFLFLILVGSAVYYRDVQPLALLQTLLGGHNLNGAQSLPVYADVLWSVAVEWQFYLLFPGLMWVVARKGSAWLWQLIALTVVVRVFGYGFGLHTVSGVYLQLIGRLDQFALGMLAGIAYHDEAARRMLRRALVPTACLIVAAASAYNRVSGGLLAEHWFKLFSPTAEGGLWAIVVAGYVSFAERSVDANGWLSRLTTAVGATSYSIYLWHFLMLTIQRTKKWVPRLVADADINSLLVLTFVTLPVVLLFAALSYHAVELPFMKLRRAYTQPRP
jgi:peptidoglycan/LPS O-acetylase OafA/YrhL